MTKSDIEGKIALVTGASKGIGRSVALELANKGVRVAINYHTSDKAAEDVVGAIIDQGGEAIAIKADVSHLNQVLRMVESIEDTWGTIDILVNNAGVNKPTDFDKITEKDWDVVLNTNLKGSFMLSQIIFPIMKKQKYGRIINISSTSGQYGGPRTVHYAVSKAGLIALGHCFARFGAPYNITNNNIAPGLIVTEMGDKMIKTKQGKKILENTLLKRPGTTKEVADLTVFLASNESSYITGQTFNVNGGLLFS